MKLSKAYLASKKMSGLAVVVTILLISFQNCSPGFILDPSRLITGSSSSGSTADTGSGKQEVGSQNAVVVNRNYVVSVLYDIFTQSNGQIRADVKSEIDNWVFIQSSQFGGGCDVNTTASGQDCGPVIPQYHGGDFLGNSISSNLSTIPIQLAVSTIRQSYMLKACENISSVTPAMDYVREKLAVPAGTEVTDAVISNMYLLYFRDDPPTPELLKIIRDLNADLKSQNETLESRWRAVFSFICELPGWQTP